MAPSWLRSEHRHGFRTVPIVVALALTLALVVSACSDEGATVDERSDTDPGWVGHVDGTDAFVAVVAGGGRVVAYVCDGDAGVGEWFAGEAESDDAFSLTAPSGAAITARDDAGAWAGSVTLADGTTHSFSAVPADGDAGLYRVESAEATRDGIEAGWIVDNEGALRGFHRVRGATRTAPPLSGGSLTVDGTAYPVVVYRVPEPDVRSPQPVPPFVPTPYPNTVAVS